MIGALMANSHLYRRSLLLDEAINEFGPTTPFRTRAERRRSPNMQFTICSICVLYRSAFESTNDNIIAGLAFRFLMLICMRALYQVYQLPSYRICTSKRYP